MAIKLYTLLTELNLTMVDKNIRKEVRQLNKLGVKTSESCSGHITPEGSKTGLTPYLTWIKSPPFFNDLVEKESKRFSKFNDIVTELQIDDRRPIGYETKGGIFLWTVHWTDEKEYIERFKTDPVLRQRFDDLFKEWKVFLNDLIRILSTH